MRRAGARKIAENQLFCPLQPARMPQCIIAEHVTKPEPKPPKLFEQIKDRWLVPIMMPTQCILLRVAGSPVNPLIEIAHATNCLPLDRRSCSARHMLAQQTEEAILLLSSTLAPSDLATLKLDLLAYCKLNWQPFPSFRVLFPAMANPCVPIAKRAIQRAACLPMQISVCLRTVSM